MVAAVSRLPIEQAASFRSQSRIYCVVAYFPKGRALAYNEVREVPGARDSQMSLQISCLHASEGLVMGVAPVYVLLHE